MKPTRPDYRARAISNSIIRNNIDLSGGGIGLDSSDGNTFFGNNITGCGYGVTLYHSSKLTRFYHNNFMMNTQHVDFRTPEANFWDDGYPSGGNFWIPFVGVDSNHRARSRYPR